MQNEPHPPVSTQELSESQTPAVQPRGELEAYTFLEGQLEHVYTQSNVRSSWDLLIPGAYMEFTEATNLLFYDREAGLAEIYLPEGPQGQLQLLKRHTGWRRGWDLILAEHFLEVSKGDSLLFYDREAGLGELHAMDGEGGVFRVARYTDWRRTWDAIVPIMPLDVSSGTGLVFTSLLFYDKAAGQGEFYSTDGQGHLSLVARHSDWRRTWDLIVPFTQSTSDANRTVLVFYDRSAGQGELYAVDGQGGIARLSKHTGWRQSWDLIIPCIISGITSSGLLFYDRSAGQGELYAVDGRGALALVSRYTDWRQTWDAIVFGTLAGPGPLLDLSLLFYER